MKPCNSSESNLGVQTPDDSLKKRYLYKIIVNLSGLLISLATQVIVTRGLGPKSYGDFSYLTNFFGQLFSFFDMNSSLCLYTKLSQRPGERALVTFYSYICLIVNALVIATVYIIYVFHYEEQIWPEQPAAYIYLALGWGILTWLTQVLSKVLDAYGVTVPAEKVNLAQRFAAIIILGLLWLMNTIEITVFFYYQHGVLILLLLMYTYLVNKYCFKLFSFAAITTSLALQYLKEFWSYVNPLFILSCLVLVTGLADRWLLQTYGGSIQQGFYGISYQIGAICFVFSRAMTPLITRELSIAFAQRNIPEMTRLFQRYIPPLYFIAAYFSCFICIQADRVLYLFGGEAYQYAAPAVAIMALYPIHQTYGQLSGSVFFATERTAAYSRISAFFMIIGIPLTYILLAEPDTTQIQTGAAGLALKMIITQFLAVNVQLYYNARWLKFSMMRNVVHQIVCVAVLIIIAMITRGIIDRLIAGSAQAPVIFVISGIVYTALVGAILSCYPAIAGLEGKDIDNLVAGVVVKIRSILKIQR